MHAVDSRRFWLAALQLLDVLTSGLRLEPSVFTSRVRSAPLVYQWRESHCFKVCVRAEHRW